MVDCLRCHFPVSVSFRLGKTRWYCVTEGGIFSVRFCFSVLETFLCQRIHLRSVFFYNATWVASTLQACFEITHVFPKVKRFSFEKAFCDAWWVTWIDIRVLKGLCTFEMGLHIKNIFFIESSTFIHSQAQECSFCFWDFSCEFDRWVKTVSLWKKIFYFVSACVPHGCNIIDESLPKDWFCVALSE